jgi:predicted Zn-ribbon and HTH transcriptional regulator
MSFDYPKTILSKVLTTFKHNPERLSSQEIDLAMRICHCTLCGNFWVRRFKKEPARCPACHKHGWNRPLITEMLNAEQRPHPNGGQQ